MRLDEVEHKFPRGVVKAKFQGSPTLEVNHSSKLCRVLVFQGPWGFDVQGHLALRVRGFGTRRAGVSIWNLVSSMLAGSPLVWQCL